MRVRLLIYLFLVILISINVQAFGISFPYMENNTLRLYPGQTYMFKLVVQNKDQEKVTVNITLESAIARLVGDRILEVPGETFDKSVFFNITIPEDAQIGDVYNINYMVLPMDRGEGQIPLVVRYDRSFKVVVIEKPQGFVEEPAPTPPPEPEKPSILKWAFIPIIVIILLLVIILIWRKSHQISRRIAKRKTRVKEQEPHQAFMPEQKQGGQPEPEYAGEESPEKPEQKPAILKQEKTEKAVSSHHYFHLRNGKNLKSLRELYAALMGMPQDEFSHHVSSSKNDFANWIEHVLENHELADKLRDTTKKQEMLEMIENELDQK